MAYDKLAERRIRYLVAISLVLLVAFAVRLVDVQAVRAAGYANRADNELAKKSIIMAPRGAITDINGVEFARSVISYRILVDQAIIDYPKKLADLAAPILGMESTELLPKLIGDRRYVVISKSVQPAVWRKLEKAVDEYNAAVMETENGFSKRLAGFFAESIPKGSLARQ